MLDEGAAPAPSPTVGVALRERRHNVPAQAPCANGRVYIGKPPSPDKRTRQEEHQSLQLHGLKHGRSLEARVQKQDKRTETVVVTGAYHAAQQVIPARLSTFFPL